MGTNIEMPQMGESVYEGTITRWLKQVGERVERDEPLYELSTDKVETEIPSPVAGTLLEIKVNEGEKVPVHSVVAVIDESGGSVPVAAQRQAAPARREEAAKPAPPPEPRPAAPPPPPAPAAKSEPASEKILSSPLVRKIAREEGVDLAQIKGTGWKGRITKEDVLEVVKKRKAGPAPAAPPSAAPPSPSPAPTPAAKAPPAYTQRDLVDIVPMTPMRAKIAEHMILSKHTSAHVTTVFEVDMTSVMKLREREKKNYQVVHGVKLTYTPFYAMAAIEAIKEFPIVNSSVDGANIVYKRNINLGVAVALPEGLIVPVVRNAEEKSFLGLCRAVNDLVERARTKKLNLEDVQGGTFTITNPGAFGGLFGTPIINQPQVAILYIGGVEKRPVVIDDAIAIRSMCYLGLTFDHRVIDGATGDLFMAKLKSILQDWKIPIK